MGSPLGSCRGRCLWNRAVMGERNTGCFIIIPLHVAPEGPHSQITNTMPMWPGTQGYLPASGWAGASGQGSGTRPAHGTPWTTLTLHLAVGKSLFLWAFKRGGFKRGGCGAGGMMLLLRQTKDGIGMRVSSHASVTGQGGQLCRQVAWGLPSTV